MRRALGIVLALAALAAAEEKKEPAVTTFVVHDAAALARGTLAGPVLEKHVVALPKDSKEGTVEGPLVEAAEPFDRACVSVNAETPGDSKVEVFAKAVLADGAKTDWLPLGVVAARDEAAKVPRSAPPFSSPLAKVDIDTVVLPQPNGRALSVLLVLRRGSGGGKGGDESPRVRRVAIVAWPHGKRDPESPEKKHPAWGKVLPVVERSQRVEDPAIAMKICSATSLGMVLSYYGFSLETRDVCPEVLDRESGMYGNWALNVAYAGRLGLDASIARFGSWKPLEDEIAAGRPVVLTHRWAAGELTGAPIASSDGHLIVARGFTKEGDVVVNDPAADPRKGEKVERIYKRADLEKTWLGNGDGVCYVIAKGAKK